MKKFINDRENIVDEMMEGYLLAYEKVFEKVDGVNAVLLKNRRKNKVSLIIGGGSGHEPMFSGFVGRGLADAAACGNIFASPNPATIYETANAVDTSRGVLFVYGCYAGDNLNFDMAEEMLQDDGIKTAHVRVQDDCSSAPKDKMGDRRGIAGDVFVVKIAGAACDMGYDLEEVTRLTEMARDNTCSIGVAASPGVNPQIGENMFELPENEIEYGMGLHGEPGVKRSPMVYADEMAETMLNEIIQDCGLKSGDEICILINGLGATTNLEMFIIYRKVRQLLDELGIKVYDSDVNSYCTSQSMGGFSITCMKLNDELKKLYDMPCASPYYAKGVM